MKEIEFVDTNILVYAYDKTEGGKHEKSKAILKSCFQGKKLLAVSNQVLGEFCVVLSRKMDKPLNSGEIEELINEIVSFDGWKKINYTHNTVLKAIKSKSRHYWDSLIAETMKENGIQKIYTENTSQFEKIPGITPINPFK